MSLQDLINEFMELREVVMETEDGSKLLRFGELRNKLFNELKVMMDIQVFMILIPIELYEDNATVQDALVTITEELMAVDKRIRIEEWEDIALVEPADIGDEEAE